MVRIPVRGQDPRDNGALTHWTPMVSGRRDHGYPTGQDALLFSPSDATLSRELSRGWNNF